MLKSAAVGEAGPPAAIPVRRCASSSNDVPNLLNASAQTPASIRNARTCANLINHCWERHSMGMHACIAARGEQALSVCNKP